MTTILVTLQQSNCVIVKMEGVLLMIQNEILGKKPIEVEDLVYHIKTSIH